MGSQGRAEWGGGEGLSGEGVSQGGAERGGGVVGLPPRAPPASALPAERSGVLAAETPRRGRPSTLPSRPPLLQGPEEAPRTPGCPGAGKGLLWGPCASRPAAPRFPSRKLPGDAPGYSRLCVPGGVRVCGSVWPECVWLLVCMRCGLSVSGCCVHALWPSRAAVCARGPVHLGLAPRPAACDSPSVPTPPQPEGEPL